MLVDCSPSLALRNQVLEVNAGLSKIGLGFQGKYESQALQQVRESTEHLAIDLENLCRDYNACVLDHERYLEEGARIRELLSRHLRLAEQRSPANGPEIGDELWSNARPDLEHARLKLSYRVEAGDGSAFRVHHSGEALKSGTEVRFVLQPNQAAFVYVLLLSSQGTPARLFPLAEQGLDNPVAAGRELTVPPPERGRLQLDSVTGTEHLQIIASAAALPALEQAFQPLPAGAKGEPPSGARILREVGQLLCADQPQTVVTSATSVQCRGRLDRGLVFAPAQAASVEKPPEVVLAAQPNDDVVVFQHEIIHL